MYLKNITEHVVECCAEEGVKDVMKLRNELQEVVDILSKVKPYHDGLSAGYLGKAEGLVKSMHSQIQHYDLEEVKPDASQ